MADNIPFLQMRFDGQAADTPAVYSVYPDGRLELVGDKNFDTTVAPDTHESRLNQVIEFEGDKYVMHGGRIFILNEGTNTWGLDAGSAATTRPAALQYGFQIVNITGVPYLVSPHSTSAASNLAYRIKRSPNFGGTTWTEHPQNLTLTDVGGDGQYFDNILFKEGFFQQFQDTTGGLTEVAKLDMSITNWSVVPHDDPPTLAVGSGSEMHGPNTFCAYNNKLYELMFAGENGNTAVPQTIYLQEIEGAAALGSLHALTIVSGLRAITNLSDNTINDRNYGRSTMFVDSNENKMYAMCVVQSGQGFSDGWACFEIEDVAGQLSYLRDVGPNIFPEQIAFATAGGNRPMAERMFHYNAVDSSGNQVVYVEYCPNPLNTNSPSNFYKWNGPDQAMEFLGFQPIGGWSKGRVKQGEGSHIYSNKVPFDFSFAVQASGSPSAPGNMELKTIIFGSGQPVELYFLFNKEGETNLTRADIYSVSSGVADEINKRITNVKAESQQISCLWRAQSDGITLNDDFTIMPFASVTGV